MVGACVAGAVGAFVVLGGFALKLFRLQVAMGAQQQTLLSLVNREKSQRSRTKAEAEQQEIKELLDGASREKVKYANDPGWTP